MSASPKPKLSRGVLAVLPLVFVPLVFAVVWSFRDSEAPEEGSPPTAPQPVAVQDSAMDERPFPEFSRAGSVPRKPEPGSHTAERREARAEEESGSPSSSMAAQEDAARIRRFDENASTFDARLETFESERDRLDPKASTSVEHALLERLETLHAGLRVDTQCAESVCVVELTSDDSVGTMIARIAPWLRGATTVATGDPDDPSDERAMRLAFDKSDALALVDQPPELLP